MFRCSLYTRLRGPGRSLRRAFAPEPGHQRRLPSSSRNYQPVSPPPPQAAWPRVPRRHASSGPRPRRATPPRREIVTARRRLARRASNHWRRRLRGARRCCRQRYAGGPGSRPVQDTVRSAVGRRARGRRPRAAPRGRLRDPPGSALSWHPGHGGRPRGGHTGEATVRQRRPRGEAVTRRPRIKGGYHRCVGSLPARLYLFLFAPWSQRARPRPRASSRLSGAQWHEVG